MTRQLRYLIIGVTFIIGSCAPNKSLETQLIEVGQMTHTACPGGGVWEVVAVNKYVFRCDTDIPSKWTKSTSPPPTQELPSQNVQGCDAVKNAILNIVDYYRFGNTQSHSQSQLENHVRTISSFLRGIGFGMEANGVDNATSLGDVLSLSQNIVEQKCGI